MLTAAESIVTFRRRYRGRDRVEAAVELLVTDARNPRSVAYQLERILGDLRAIPNTSPTARPLRLADALAHRSGRSIWPSCWLRRRDRRSTGRAGLGEFLADLLGAAARSLGGDPRPVPAAAADAAADVGQLGSVIQ